MDEPVAVPNRECIASGEPAYNASVLFLEHLHEFSGEGIGGISAVAVAVAVAAVVGGAESGGVLVRPSINRVSTRFRFYFSVPRIDHRRR